MVRGALDRKMDGEGGRTKGKERDKGQGENKSGKEKWFRRVKRPVAGRRSSSEQRRKVRGPLRLSQAMCSQGNHIMTSPT